MKLPSVQLAVHVRVGEKNLRSAAFEDDVEQIGPAQIVERLCGKDHGGVVFAPGLKGLDDIALNAGILQKHPSLIDKEGLEDLRDGPVANDGVGAVQDVEQQRFQKFGNLARALKVETLEPGK